VEAPSPGSSRARRARWRALPRSRRLALLAALAAPVILAGCQVPTFGAYKGATTQGQDAFKLWQGFFIAGLVVGGFVLLLIVYAVVRYRKRSDALPRQTQYHTLIEILYTIIPIVTVLGLFVFTVITENEVDAVPPGPVQVDVYAFQWGWEFFYPQTGRTVIGETTEAPQMVVPAGQTVNIDLQSRDTIHGFYVPQFNFSRYAQPGVANKFNINVIHPGVYRGQCTQLCGIYHSLMFFSVKAVTPGAFQTWVHNVSGKAKTIAEEKAKIRDEGPGS
jgi:cytochrome c oxidase subunit 2